MQNISVKKLIHLIKYQLFSNYLHIVINIAVIVLNIIIAVIVTNAVEDNNAGSGSLDAIYLVWLFIIGLSFFVPSFRFALLSGVSRKTYFLSSIISLTVFALILSIICSLFILLAESVANTFTLYTMMYGNNVLGLFIWMFAVGILIEMLGWFVISVFYRTSKKQRLIICALLLLVPSIFILINFLTNGVIQRYLIDFILNIMGLATVPNPFISAVSLLIISFVLCAATYLLLRKAEIKDN